jgi:predicted nucleotidyltransferase
MAKRITKESLNSFVSDLRSTHGDNLISVVLYGSVTTGEHFESHGDYNLLIVLNQITPNDLRLAQAPIRELQRLGHPIPVYFTWADLQTAADVFPIEFHQMERARIVLYGKDPFETLKISDVNLRHQTEYELRSKLLQLRRLYIPASVSAERLSALMCDSVVSFAGLFAAVLILSGKQPPVAKQESIVATVKLLNLDNRPFEKILTMCTKGSRPLSDVEANELFAGYLVQIERVIEAIDRMDVQS